MNNDGERFAGILACVLLVAGIVSYWSWCAAHPCVRYQTQTCPGERICLVQTESGCTYWRDYPPHDCEVCVARKGVDGEP